MLLVISVSVLQADDKNYYLNIECLLVLAINIGETDFVAVALSATGPIKQLELRTGN